MYHRVLPEADCAAAQANHALNVSTRHFDEHLVYLKKRFDVVPLTELVENLERREETPKRPKLAITFDDGWHDNHDHAWAILKKHNLTATIFLISDYIGKKQVLWWSALEHHYRSLGNPPISEWISALTKVAENISCRDVQHALSGKCPDTPEDVVQLFKDLEHHKIEAFVRALNLPADAPELIDWDQARQMQDDCINFGAHTRRHELLTLLESDAIEATVKGSLEELSARGIHAIPVFSYPNGNNNKRVQTTIARVGYKYAVGTKNGTISGTRFNGLELPRINIGGGNKADVKLLRRRLARAFWLQR